MLPVELYGLIIGHLHDDTDTLKACSLTCKTFLHLSWYHLFNAICLDGGPDTKRFLDNISIHSSTSPCTYIRYLVLQEEHEWLNNANALSLLTTRLPNVTSLQLSFQLNGLDDTQRAMILSGFQKVTFLDLDDCWFHTFAQMTEFIASFPLLKHLGCSSDTDWSKYEEPMTPLPQSINKITLRDYHSKFFDQLLNLEPHPNVRVIELLEMTGKSMKEVNKLLKTLGSHLEDIQIGKISSKIVSHFSADDK
jgi:hypothetical protein